MTSAAAARTARTAHRTRRVSSTLVRHNVHHRAKMSSRCARPIASRRAPCAARQSSPRLSHANALLRRAARDSGPRVALCGRHMSHAHVSAKNKVSRHTDGSRRHCYADGARARGDGAYTATTTRVTHVRIHCGRRGGGGAPRARQRT